jgi:glycosyltransferase involved in cell wall biosynthesis
MQPTKISVVVTAYNHEKYVGECLDGILQQKGTFVLEVILGDDCSLDRTRQIMQGYQGKYPDVFVLLPPTANLGIQNNIRRCLAACSGEYIAFCEGDDYWTDKYKLQKQLEFLEGHPDHSLCFHAVVLYFESEGRYALTKAQSLPKKDSLTTEDLIESNYICGFSVCMYRASVVRNIPEEIFGIYAVDWMFNMACGRLGKIGYIRDWMSVYRIHAKGAWGGKSRTDQLRDQITNIDPYNHFFSYEYDEQFRKLKERLYRLYIYERIRQACLKIPMSMITIVMWVMNKFQKGKNTRNVRS